MNNRIFKAFGAALLAGVAATTAFAGGPNYVFDNANEIPYRWKLENWPGGKVPVYTDLGGLGLMSNATATDWATRAWDQWNNVPTSSFEAQVVGNVSLLGLGDITPANVAQVFPKFNGGGITVVYDYDGKIFKDYLGLGQNRILGIAYMEFAAPGTDEILESTVFINGFMQYFNDTDGAGMSGVFTHEFGHALNLAHSQANGAVLNTAVNDAPSPYGCASKPYAGAPTNGQVETMYPFLDQRITGTSRHQFTVDRLDDIAAISDLYPAPGWPENYGTIKGTVSSLTKINGSGTGPTKEVTAVNVIARNVNDPFNDFISTVTGEMTRGFAGPDGSFELHGLTPGAQYVLYVDNLAAGAYPYPRMVTLPGPEEWYNGSLESGNGETDDRCAWSPVAVSAGMTATADITFNRVKGAPVWDILSVIGEPRGISADGSVIVGVNPNPGSYWIWSVTDGYQNIGGYPNHGGNPGISDDGMKIAGNVKDTDGITKWGLYDRATQTWSVVPPPSTAVPCSNANGPYIGTVWNLSGDGSTIVGSTINNTLCRKNIATKWTAAAGSELLEKYPNTTTNPSSRANWASYDGSVIGGWDNSPGKNGVYWQNGVEHFLGAPNQNPYVNEALFVTRDGSTIIGGQSNPDGAWKHYTTNDSHETIHQALEGGTSFAFRTNDAGTVVSGFDRMGSDTQARLWTPELGWVDLTSFLNAQGAYAQGTVAGWSTALSADGKIWAGTVVSSEGMLATRIEIPKVIVCHKSPGGSNPATHNLDVSFPDGLGDHLAHGDTVGLCQHGGE